MKPRSAYPSFAALAAVFLFNSLPAAAGTAVDLFNGKDLSGWVFFAGDNVPPPSDTWSVSEGILKCSGKPNGYLRTEGRHSDYELTVEWRWVPGPAPVGNDGRPRNRNNGVLLHMQGEDAIWPKSIEAQLMEGNAGDFYGIGGVRFAEIDALRDDALAKAGDDAEAIKRANAIRRTPRRQESSENPIGEWNTYLITCSGDTITTVVNGVEQNRATRLSIQEGHICLQSEGAPIEFRTVRLKPLAN